MPKRKKGEGGSSGEMESAGMMRWLLTYADMLTLMFALFVIMYALAADGNPQRAQEVAAQFRAVFGVVTGGSTILPSEGSNQGVHWKIVAGEPEEGGAGGVKKPAVPPRRRPRIPWNPRWWRRCNALLGPRRSASVARPVVWWSVS
jgi:chemotaxis protein MotB